MAEPRTPPDTVAQTASARRAAWLSGAATAAACCVTLATFAGAHPPTPALILILAALIVFSGVAMFIRYGRSGIDQSRVWQDAPVGRRAALMAAAAILVGALLAGGLPTEAAAIRDGKYVAEDRGRVLRVLTEDQYHEVQARESRLVLAIGGLLGATLWFLWSAAAAPARTAP